MDFRKGESGQVLVMTVLSLTVVIGFVAFATDVGVMLRQRRMAQTAADAAAFAAATESLNEGTPTTVTSGMYEAAEQDATLNGFTPGESNGTANSSTGVTLTLNINPDISISGYNYAGYVQAVVSLNTGTAFMKLFGINSMNVAATAIASNTIASDGCFYVQNGGDLADPAVSMNGNSLVAATSCGMTVNGDLTMGGNGNIDAKFVAVSGTFTGKNASNTWSEGVPPTNDPESKLQVDLPTAPTGSQPCGAPGGMACVYDYGCDTGTCKANGCGSTTCTLNNGATLGSTSTSTVPGTLYYYDKSVVVSGQVTANNVTFFLSGDSYFDFDNNGLGTFEAPAGDPTNGCKGSTNPLCGILIDAPTDGSSGGTYTCSSGKGNNATNPGELYFDFGSSTTTVEGIIYAPYMQLYGQDQGASTTFNTDLIVGNLCMQSSTFTIGSFSGARSPLTRVGLVY